MKKLLLSAVALVLLVNIDIFSVTPAQRAQAQENLNKALQSEGFSISQIDTAYTILTGVYPSTQKPSALEPYLTNIGFTQAQAVQIVTAYIKYMPV